MRRGDLPVPASAPYQVAIDYWAGTTHASGKGRYVRELVRALCALPSGPRLLLLDVGPQPRRFDAKALGLASAPERARRVRARVPRGVLRWTAQRGERWFERRFGQSQLGLRVFPQPALPCCAWSVLALPELPPADSPEAQTLQQTLAQRCDVFVFSPVAAREALRRFELAPERVHTLPVGAEHWAREVEADATLPPSIVCLGRTDAARAPLQILRAFEQLRDQGTPARLAFLGRRGDRAHELERAIAASKRADAIEWQVDPSEPSLARRVGEAALLVHLNREEWTPVTPLEGLAQGASVLVSPLEAFRVALGDMADYSSDLEPRALAEALGRGIARGLDPMLRQARRRFAAAFSWEQHARLTLEAWQRIVEREKLCR